MTQARGASWRKRRARGEERAEPRDPGRRPDCAFYTPRISCKEKKQEGKEPQRSPRFKTSPVLTDANRAVTKIHPLVSVELSQPAFNPRLVALKVLNLTHQVVAIGIKLSDPGYDDFEARVLSLARPVLFSMRYLVALLLAARALRLSFPARAHAAQGH